MSYSERQCSKVSLKSTCSMNREPRGEFSIYTALLCAATTFALCQAKTETTCSECHQPQNPDHGQWIQKPGSVSERKAKFVLTCDEGYIRTNRGKRVEAPNAGVVCRCPKGKSAIWPGADYQCARNAAESGYIACADTPFPHVDNSEYLRINESYGVGECHDNYKVESPSYNESRVQTKFSLTCSEGSWEKIKCVEIRCREIALATGTVAKFVQSVAGLPCERESYSVGSCVEHKCSANNRALIAVCLPNGEWSSYPEPCATSVTARSKYCRHPNYFPKNLDNVQFVLIGDGTAVTLCNKNYRFDGKSRRFGYLGCVQGWTTFFCQEVKCKAEDPRFQTDPIQIRKEPPHPILPGSRMELECYPSNLRLVPTNTTICLPSGEWTQPVPSTCIEPNRRCAHPQLESPTAHQPVIANASNIPDNGHSPSARLVWSCGRGYAEAGFTQVCNGLTGLWEPPVIPACTPVVHCPFSKSRIPTDSNSIPTIENAESVTFRVGDRITFTCKNTSYYHYRGDATWTCTEKQTWDVGTQAFTCRRIYRPCSLPKEAGATVLMNGYSIKVKPCKRGKGRPTLKANTTLTCQENGLTKPSYEFCERVTCPKPQSSRLCKVKLHRRNTYFVGEDVSYSAGNGKGKATCSDTGQWILTGPPCESFTNVD